MKKLIGVYLIAVIFCIFPLHWVEGQGDFELILVSDRGIDLDNDGLFDQLEIVLECNITVTDNYILQTGSLVSTNGTLIPVTGSQEVFLEMGEHVFTILLEGRQIRSYELDFVNISRVDLINSDYTQAGFLNDIHLSRMYRFIEFEVPPIYDLGLEPGDWMRYKVTNIWQSNSTGLQEPLNKLLSIAIEVEDIVNNLVTLELALLYESGEIASEVIEGYIEPQSQIYPFISPLGLEVNNPVNGFNVNKTVTGKVLGEDRQINIFEIENFLVQGSDELSLSQRQKWDYSTGVLTDSWFNTTYKEVDATYITYNNVSLELYTTNVIPQITSINLSTGNATTIGEELSITAYLFNYHMDAVKNQTILFKLNDEEFDSVISDENGLAQTQGIFNKYGEQKIEAFFEGAPGYMATNSQKVIQLTKPGNNYTLIISVIAVVIVIGAAVAYTLLKK